MLQTIIAGIIITAAVILSVIYIIRSIIRIKNKDKECGCCDQKKTTVCRDNRIK